jgi:hypothetical protein
MGKIATVIVLAGLAWYGYTRYEAEAHRGDSELVPASQMGAMESASSFKCDGRTHCSQMTSCAEATYFIEHCPNTKMDGNNDGVPCERQWCK